MKYLWCVLMGVFLMMPVHAKKLSRSERVVEQARVHTDLASHYHQAGQMATAVEEAQLALRSEPGYVPARMVLALIYAQLKQVDLADEQFALALKLSAQQKMSQTDLRNSYAWYLCNSGRANEALQEFALVLRDPLYASLDKALTNAGVCAARMKRTDLAMPYLNAAIDVGANNGVAYLYRAHLLVNEAKYALARADLNQAETLLQSAPELIWLRVRLQHAEKSNQLKQAIDELITQFPVSEQASWARAERYDVF